MSIVITTILFVVVLGILVFSHELGHFSIAKLFKIKVEEFGFGFPPRIWGKKKGETTYSINWIPFGGFVKIFGEDNEEALNEEDKKRSFVHKPKLVQVAVLLAGIVFNIILAWILVSIVVSTGVPASVGSIDVKYLNNIELKVVSVLENSPAGKAKLSVGDTISYIRYKDQNITGLNIGNFNDEIAKIKGDEFSMGIVDSEKNTKEINLKAEKGVWEGDKDMYALGIGIDMVGTVKVPFYMAPIFGAKLTWQLTKATFMGYAHIIVDLFKGQGGKVLGMVSGPLGIASLVGSAYQVGLTSLLMLTAIISVSLAIINLLPFPALDGGRVLFVIIETIKGSPIKTKTAQMFNIVGFFILIGLLLVVTFHDITKLFS